MSDRNSGWWDRDQQLRQDRDRERYRDGADAYGAGRQSADLHGEDRSFDDQRASGPGFTGPRYGAGGYNGYTGRGVTGGYGQNGSDPGRRVSEYGDRIYRGGAGGGGQAEDYSRGGRFYGDDGREEIYPQEYGQSHADYGSEPYGYHRGGRYAGSGSGRFDRNPGHRGLGPQGYTRSDQRINEDVHDRLTDDDHIDASGISVTVQDGEVTLSGTISDRRAKHHAEAIIEHIGGVKHVQNNLRVDSSAGGAAAPLGENPVLRDQAEGKT